MAEETLEERIRVLEEQVSAMSASALAASEPSGYYTSKYSGEEIDALLDRLAAMQ